MKSPGCSWTLPRSTKLMRLGLETEGRLAMNAMCYAKICNSSQWIFNERSLCMLNLWPFQNAPLHVDMRFEWDVTETAEKWGKLLNVQCFSNLLLSVAKVFCWYLLWCTGGGVLPAVKYRYNSYLLGKWRGICSSFFLLLPKIHYFPYSWILPNK